MKSFEEFVIKYVDSESMIDEMIASDLKTMNIIKETPFVTMKKAIRKLLDTLQIIVVEMDRLLKKSEIK